jgi:RNA polymerase sigma-70 factor (ECF subfamily)
MDGSLSQTFARWRSNGDPRQLAEVFDRASPELLRVAIHLVGDVGAAEDLVQATFLTAIERAKTFDESRRLEPWLAGILENHARELARHAARTPDPERLEQRLVQTPLDEALARELSAEVAAAIDRMPEPYRRTILLRVRHGLAPADIAHVLGESPGAVRVRLHRALEMLRKQLPAGIALGALFALEPARGMSSVKAAVLAAGGGGVLVMKKVLVGAALLALLLLTWWKWPAVAPDVANAVTPKVAEAALESTPERLSTPGVGADARTAADSAAPQPAYHFPGLVIDGETEAPLADATVELYRAQHLRLSEIKRRYADVIDPEWSGIYSGILGWPVVEPPVTLAQRTDKQEFTLSAPPVPGEAAVASSRTGADGRFDFVEPEPQGFFICKREGYATRFVPMRRSFPTGNIREGQEGGELLPLESLVVRMYHLWTLHGFLIDPRGERVHERVRLGFSGSRSNEGLRRPPIDDPDNVFSTSIETEADGSFSVEVAGAYVNVIERDPRWSLSNTGMHPALHQEYVFSTCWEPGKQVEPALVVVRRSPQLRVRDRATHSPIENLVVIARNRTDGSIRLSGRYFARRGEMRLVPAWLGGTDLPESQPPVLLTVWAEGYAAASVPASLTLDGADVEIELDRGEQPIFEGELRRQGHALPGVPLSIAPEGAAGWPDDDFRVIDAVRTDSQGRFAFRLPPGFYVLRFAVDGSPRKQGIELPSTRPLVIDLDEDASVRVHVQSSTGAPCSMHPVSLMSGNKYTRRMPTDAQGNVLFEGLPAGTWTLALFYDAGQQWGTTDVWTEFELAAGRHESLEVVIPVPEPRFAHLAVLGETDLSSWRVHDTDWSSGRLEPIEADGRVPIDIQTGNHGFEFENGGSQSWFFWVPKSPPPDLVLRIDPTGPAYEVELVDAVSRGPIPGAYVVGVSDRSSAEGRPLVAAFSDARGLARLSGLASGPVRLSIRMRSLEPRAASVPWGALGGALEFAPVQPPGTPALHVVIELPKCESERFSELPEIHLTGIARIHGAALREISGQACAVQVQASGTLLLRPKTGRFRTAEDGRYELWMPFTGQARFQMFAGLRPGQRDSIEWEPTPGLSEQSRDFDF